MAKFEILFTETSYKSAVVEGDNLGEAMEQFYREWYYQTLKATVDENECPRIDSIYEEDREEKIWEHDDVLPKNGMSYDDFHQIMEVDIDGTKCYMYPIDVYEEYFENHDDEEGN